MNHIKYGPVDYKEEVVNLNTLEGHFKPFWTMEKTNDDVISEDGDWSVGNLIPQKVEPDNYKELKMVLDRAYLQASVGKGKDRHANGLPFHQQPILVETRSVGIGFPAGQARKKVQEATNCYKDHPERAIADLLGAINYIAAEIIFIEEGM